MTATFASGQTPEPVSKAEQARQITERSLEELSNQLAAGNSATLDAYLRALGRFHRYSFGNVMLIMFQKPDATHVAGFHTWRTMGRSVKKGEKGIAIFAPMMLKPREPDRQQALRADEQSAAPQLRFRVVYVFDASQTEGEPMPTLTRVGGDPGEALARLENAVRDTGVTLETVDDLGGALGKSSGGLIRLASGLSDAERFSVLVHEWAHEILHQTIAVEERPNKTVRETEAEAVAFVVGQAIGLENASASADYIRLYQGDKDTLSASLDRVQKAACRIIEAILGEGERSPLRHPAGPRQPLAAAAMHRTRGR